MTDMSMSPFAGGVPDLASHQQQQVEMMRQLDMQRRGDVLSLAVGSFAPWAKRGHPMPDSDTIMKRAQAFNAYVVAAEGLDERAGRMGSLQLAAGSMTTDDDEPSTDDIIERAKTFNKFVKGATSGDG